MNLGRGHSSTHNTSDRPTCSPHGSSYWINPSTDNTTIVTEAASWGPTHIHCALTSMMGTALPPESM